MIVPAEVMGSHIGPERSHTTGRRHTMAFRGATAMFGHLGVEADVTRMSEDELAELAHVITVHKRFRSLIHSGDTVRFDTDVSAVAHGVIARDRSEALVSFAQMALRTALAPEPLRVRGLDPAATYTVEMIPLTRAPVPVPGTAVDRPRWVTDSLAGRPQRLSGAFLRDVGLVPPVMWPESAVVVHLRRS